MATWSQYDLFKKAKSEGVSMKDLARRGGLVTQKRKRRKKLLEDRFKDLQDRGGDWWNK